MVICSNTEFEQLAKSRGGRLVMISRDRAQKNPNGHLSVDEVHKYIRTLSYTEPKNTIAWLKNLIVLAQNGTIQRLKRGAATWEDHVEHVRVLYAAKELPLNIGNHIQCKDSKRYGTVVDYIPDTQEYVVALDPFQIITYKKKDITKVAKKLTSEEVMYVKTQNVMYDLALTGGVVDLVELVTITAKATRNPSWADTQDHWVWDLGKEVLNDVIG